jgi:hypothetical protein
MKNDPSADQEAARNQRSDQVEPMHDGAKAEADDSDGRRETDSERGPSESERGEPASPGGTTGEHSGQMPRSNARKEPD